MTNDPDNFEFDKQKKSVPGYTKLNSLIDGQSSLDGEGPSRLQNLSIDPIPYPP